MSERFEQNETALGSIDAGAASVVTPSDVTTGERPPASPLTTITAPPIALAIILTSGVLMFVVNLGGYPLYTKGEPREAVTVFDIVHGGGVILPMRAGVEIPSKPLLMHWLAALVSIVAGAVNEWTVRLPSAILAIAGMAVCYCYVRRLFEQRAALFAALILGTSFQYLQAGTGSRVDMALTFFMEVAFFEFIAIAEGLSARITTFFFAIALAVLTKGPVGAALPALVVTIWIVVWRRWSLMRCLRFGRGALIVGIVGGVWYLAAIAVGGMDFIHKQLLDENVYRLIHHGGFHQGHAHPFYYEEAALAAGFMPWSPIALAAAIQYVRRPREIEPRFGYLIVWFLTVLIFYNLPQSKRGVYLLALYPALSAIVAILICEAIDHRATIASWIKALSCAAGVSFTVAGIGAIAALALLHRWPAPIHGILALCGIRAPGMIPALISAADGFRVLSIVIPIATATIGIYLMLSSPQAENMTFGIAAGSICIALAVNLVVEPAIANTTSVKDFAEQTMRTAGGSQVGYFGSLDYGFAFYSGRNIRFLSPRDADPPEFVVTPEDYLKLMPAAQRGRYTIILRSNPTNLDGTSPLLLLERSRPVEVPSGPPSTQPPRLSL
jgi:4-amino-4-deoxy-L-arabinose transferase-like glycosyltransferase